MTTKEGFFAVMRRTGRGTLRLAGPYATYPEASEAVRWTRNKAAASGDPQAIFDTYGVEKLTIAARDRFPRGVWTPHNLFRTVRTRDGYVIEHATPDEIAARAAQPEFVRP